MSLKQPQYLPPADNGLDIVYRDDMLLVVNKPSGLLSVPGRGIEKYDSLAVRVRARFPGALVVHRLDMATSGLFVMALTTDMQRAMGGLFERRRIAKCYQARVAGKPDAVCGRIDLPLLTDWPNRPRQKVDFVNGRAARTDYRLLARESGGDASRIRLMPRTGRSHQLRVHMAAIGHPILGDELYGSAEDADRLQLHAASLTFDHPLTGERLSLCSEPPF